MLRIAVCDDEIKELNQTEKLLNTYLQAHPQLNGQVFPFSDPQTLLAQWEAQGRFDLYVLDIIMPEMSGIETGRQLRALGDHGEIIFLTNSNEFAADSYDVRAFFYLLKPVEKDKLFQVMNGVAKKRLQRQSSAIVVNTTKGTRRILLERIRYAERVGRFIRYHCVDDIVDSQTIRAPFREVVAPLLADRRFQLCGASFVINNQYVTGMKSYIATLDNGETIPLPRAAAADFKRAWGNYWLAELDEPR